MAASVNKVILIGNLGKDPDVRSMSSGKAVANVTIATNESWKDRNTGEKQERTEWHNVVFNSSIFMLAMDEQHERNFALKGHDQITLLRCVELMLDATGNRDAPL